MLLEARDLTRDYGSFRAVDGVSFGIERGEIVGLLGPNGAGKTTTMRMLAGFLPATAGTATVAGWDAHRHPVQAHRHIGYMPENNPLYLDMRVREDLAFRAELKGLARRDRRSRVAHCVERCHVADVAEQIIGTLSKGYRQRVGIADALLAEPDVLILDEPTIGLDPNQVRETRELIRSLGRNHTVLISTHILAEAEMVCGRVLIIVGGRLEADDTPRNLADSLFPSEVYAEIRAPRADVVPALRTLTGVWRVRATGSGDWTRFEMTARPSSDPRAAIARMAAEHRWALRELTMRRASLENVFHHITKRTGTRR